MTTDYRTLVCGYYGDTMLLAVVVRVGELYYLRLLHNKEEELGPFPSEADAEAQAYFSLPDIERRKEANLILDVIEPSITNQ